MSSDSQRAMALGIRKSPAFRRRGYGVMLKGCRITSTVAILNQQSINDKGVVIPRKPRMYLPGVPCHIIQRGNNQDATFFQNRTIGFIWNAFMMRVGSIR